MIKISGLLVVAIIGLLHVSLNFPGSAKYSIGFYNVENLFDTERDPSIFDEDFTPSGKNKWTPEKYLIKLDNLSKVISSLGDKNGPILVGMAEIENKKVLEDLVRAKFLKGKKYGIIHQNSKDERGIDVAAIYRTDVLKQVAFEYLEVVLPKNDHTRDILYIKASVMGKYPIHVFYNHWPSRREGEKESEPKRLAAAKILKAKLDKVKKEFPNEAIFVLGDFNDEPTNKSIQEILNAGKPADKSKSMVNLSFLRAEKKEGTHFFKGEWNMLDQILVNRGLYEKTSGLILSTREAQLFREDWVLFKHKDGSISPSKSYSGPVFHKTGYSDHLAVFVSLEIK